MATLASFPVWAHLLSGDAVGVVEHAHLQRPSSDAFPECGSPPLSQHWESQEMDYSSHYLMPPPHTHLTSSSHLSALQWASAATADGVHHANHLQHCPEPSYQPHEPQSAPHPELPRILPTSNLHSNHSNEAHDENRDCKRAAASMGSGEELPIIETFTKKPRLEQSPNVPFKMQVRKEKLGERITALQQLVSPFGKTDTASVLLEAIGYIKFLQEQVQVLSTPYMKPNLGPSLHHDSAHDVGNMSWRSAKVKNTDDSRQDLRSRGLCLVPVSCTLQVANDNGADFWTPAIGGSCRLRSTREGSCSAFPSSSSSSSSTSRLSLQSSLRK